jgi:uncharacterized protein
MMELGNEPSVEDILRSIKRVIADNDDMRALKPPRTRTVAAESLRRSTVSDADVLNLSELDMAPTDNHADGDIDSHATEALLADEAAQSVRHSMAALAAMTQPGARPQIVRSGETSLEGMVRDMLRPMLKEWLDANLPDMVEKTIAAEIARLRG